MMHEQQRVERLLTAALECSVYIAPTNPGLTFEELSEVGKRLGLQPGEMNDAFPALPVHHEYGRKLLPDGLLSGLMARRARSWNAVCLSSVRWREAPREPGSKRPSLLTFW